ncbi:hypothetical protein VNO77_25853 [Canavalia gladiata]|uniref:Uncharacterized protein n=1 Tax=Canavalia gladiata TaxID=3824 RepID=A0AAN9Q552_CANGL
MFPSWASSFLSLFPFNCNFEPAATSKFAVIFFPVPTPFCGGGIERGRYPEVRAVKYILMTQLGHARSNTNLLLIYIRLLEYVWR